MWPWRRAAQLGAKVLMIGCPFTSLSLVHAAEEVAQSPYLPIFCWSHLGCGPWPWPRTIAAGRPA